MIKYSFQCRTKQNKYRADLSTLKLTFTNNQEIITFNLTLNLHIHWLSSSRLLIGFQIENREFYSEHKALMKLKTKLSLKVIFHGVNHFYKTLNHLGQGSSGTVLLAQSVHSNQKFAVKCIPRSSITQEDLNKEAQILKELQNPHIAELIEIFESSSHYYLVMEAMCNRLHQNPDHDEIKIIIEQILIAVNYIHEQGILHRDIKPANIMFDECDQIKLIDFGLAEYIGLHQFNKPICGTPGYIGPEVLLKQHYDHRSDIFSIGAIMYELYSGKPLIMGNLRQDILMNNANFYEIFDLMNWPAIPDQGLDLMKRLLSPHVERLCSFKALQHPYFKLISQPKQRQIRTSLKPKFTKYIGRNQSEERSISPKN